MKTNDELEKELEELKHKISELESNKAPTYIPVPYPANLYPVPVYPQYPACPGYPSYPWVTWC